MKMAHINNILKCPKCSYNKSLTSRSIGRYKVIETDNVYSIRCNCGMITHVPKINLLAQKLKEKLNDKQVIFNMTEIESAIDNAAKEINEIDWREENAK